MFFTLQPNTAKILNALLINYFIVLFLAPVFSYFFLLPDTFMSHEPIGEIISAFIQILIQSFIFSVAFFIAYCAIVIFITEKVKDTKLWWLLFSLVSIALFAVMFNIDIGISSLVQKSEIRISYIILHFCCLPYFFINLSRTQKK